MPDGAASVIFVDLPNTNFPGVPPALGGVRFRNAPLPSFDDSSDGLVVAAAAAPPKGVVVEEKATPPKPVVPKIGADAVVDEDVDDPKKDGLGTSGSAAGGVVFGTPNTGGALELRKELDPKVILLVSFLASVDSVAASGTGGSDDLGGTIFDSDLSTSTTSTADDSLLSFFGDLSEVTEDAEEDAY